MVGQNKEPLKKIRKIELMKEGDMGERDIRGGGNIFRNRDNSVDHRGMERIW